MKSDWRDRIILSVEIKTLSIPAAAFCTDGSIYGVGKTILSMEKAAPSKAKMAPSVERTSPPMERVVA